METSSSSSAARPPARPPGSLADQQLPRQESGALFAAFIAFVSLFLSSELRHATPVGIVCLLVAAVGWVRSRLHSAPEPSPSARDGRWSVQGVVLAGVGLWWALGGIGVAEAAAFVLALQIALRSTAPRGARHFLEVWIASTLLIGVVVAVAPPRLGALLLNFFLLGLWLGFTALFLAKPGPNDPPESRAPGVPMHLAPARRPLIALACITCLIAVPIYFLLPRPPRPLDALTAAPARTIGFSDEVRFDSVTAMRGNPAVAFEAQVPTHAYIPRWRVLALEDFDGVRWRNVPAPARPPAPAADPPEMEASIRLLTPLGKGWLPVPPRTRAVEDLPADLALLRDGDDSFRLAQPPGGVRFRAVVGTAESAPDAPGEDLLAVPPALRSSLADLRQRLIPPGTPQEVLPYVVASQFRQWGEYSLELTGFPQGPGALSYFFETWRGHCEFFATATALLLRDAGVPARLVVGFGEGEVQGSRITVRSGHAHAWVEAWTGSGWEPIDPTPPNGNETTGGASGAGEGTGWNSVDAMLARFVLRVASYDGETQQRLLRSAGRSMVEGLRRWEDGALLTAGERLLQNATEPAILALALGLLLLNGGAWWLWARGRRARAAALQGNPLLLRLARCAGVRQLPPGGTAREALLPALRQAGWDAERAEAVVAAYEAWRYTDRSAALEEAVRAFLRQGPDSRASS